MQEDFFRPDVDSSVRSDGVSFIDRESLSLLRQAEVKERSTDHFLLPQLELYGGDKVNRLPEAPVPKDLKAYEQVKGLFKDMNSEDFQTREAAGKELKELMYSSRPAYAACINFIKSNRHEFTPEQQAYASGALNRGACSTSAISPLEIARDLQMYAKNPKLLEDKLQVLKFLYSIPQDERYGTHGGELDQYPYWTSDRFHRMLNNMEQLRKEVQANQRSGDGAQTPAIVLDYMAATLRHGALRSETKAVVVDFVKELVKEPRNLFLRIPADEEYVFDDIAEAYLAAGGDPKVLLKVKKEFDEALADGKPFVDRRGDPHYKNALSAWGPKKKPVSENPEP